MSFDFHAHAFGALVYRGGKYHRPVSLSGQTRIAVHYRPVPAFAMVGTPGIEGSINYMWCTASRNEIGLVS